jgi:putative DNA primase/helicase
VAIVISIRYPGARITIAADNDTKTEGNPGLTAGRAAAAAVGGRLIYPDFDDELFDGTDWNDYINGGGAM